MTCDADKRVKRTGWMTGGVMEINSAETMFLSTEN